MLIRECVLYLTSAVVDTTEEGRLEESTLLKPFKEGGDFTKFGESGVSVITLFLEDGRLLLCFLDQLNYSINVYEEGNVLCIVTTGGISFCMGTRYMWCLLL